jgi:hypothetical protein
MWFGIRCIYLFGEKSEGIHIFEERVVCFEAESCAAALEKAKQESEQYAQSNEIEIVGDLVGYQQDGDALIDGYEVWSELFESHESPGEFYANRYAKYCYHPE